MMVQLIMGVHCSTCSCRQTWHTKINLVHAAVMILMCLLSRHRCEARRGVSRAYSHSEDHSSWSYDGEHRVRTDRISSYASFVEKLSHPCAPHSRVTRSHRGHAPLDRVKLVSTLSTLERVNSVSSLLQLHPSGSLVGAVFQLARVVRTLQRTPSPSPSPSSRSSPSPSPSSSTRSRRETEEEAGVETAELRNLVAGIQMMLTEHVLEVIIIRAGWPGYSHDTADTDPVILQLGYSCGQQRPSSLPSDTGELGANTTLREAARSVLR